ncbi:hypothetical protein [Paracoccus alcaliphilus]|uniref:hypothetical protein n=1 Tax=Paracoccus alcaliphilus TaxID=34002 RepID=UPI0023504A26|nr:hypothetical protein [Paracoccus alcaliphilus]WCR18746.1 hypothetical protein JHW40_03220 [Paracoccus alcaliphilus]
MTRETNDDPVLDPKLGAALSELLAQVDAEPISPRLRELARQLEAALEDSRKSRAK